MNNQKRIKNRILKLLTKYLLDENTQLFDLEWREYPQPVSVDGIIQFTHYDGRFTITINGINPKHRKTG